MSKRGYISRYSLIIKKLKAKPYATYEELESYIYSQFEYMQMQDDTLQMGFSKRTLQRDLKEIRNVFGLDIEYSKERKGYFICNSETENMNFQRMMETFDMFNSLNLAQDLKPFLFLENRQPQGTENIYGLIHAIKNRFLVKFSYQKFWEDAVTQRTLSPYALKEFKNRWYLMGNDGTSHEVKSFALDRLSNLDITKQLFQKPAEVDIESKFKHCFGILSSTVEGPQEVILSFDPVQGKYIKSLPLHPSQVVVLDNDQELRIKLYVLLTHDFIMELLSYGNNVKVVAPEILISRIKQSLANTLGQYT